MNKKRIVTILIVIATLVLAGVAVFTAIRLYQLRQQSVTPTTPESTPSAATTCTEQCPGSDGVLRNCTPPESDGTSEDSLCNAAGRVESCGGEQYCCPAVGGTWTTDMSTCAAEACTQLTFTVESPSPSPSGSPTSTPSGSPTATPTESPTATTTATATATSSPTTEPELPDAGVSYPTIIGGAAGILLILLSLILAL